MAERTISDRNVFLAGSEWRESGTFVMATAADFQLQTKLPKVTWFRVQCVSTNDGPEAIFYYNSNTAADNTADPGMVYVDADGATAWADGETYLYEAGSL